MSPINFEHYYVQMDGGNLFMCGDAQTSNVPTYTFMRIRNPMKVSTDGCVTLVCDQSHRVYRLLTPERHPPLAIATTAWLHADLINSLSHSLARKNIINTEVEFM